MLTKARNSPFTFRVPSTAHRRTSGRMEAAMRQACPAGTPAVRLVGPRVAPRVVCPARACLFLPRVLPCCARASFFGRLFPGSCFLLLLFFFWGGGHGGVGGGRPAPPRGRGRRARGIFCGLRFVQIPNTDIFRSELRPRRSRPVVILGMPLKYELPRSSA